MALILRVPALQAHSTLRYAAWRAVVAEFAAGRLGGRPGDLLPQLVAHLCLGAALTAYEQWLRTPADLSALLGRGAARAGRVLGGLRRRAVRSDRPVPRPLRRSARRTGQGWPRGLSSGAAPA